MVAVSHTFTSAISDDPAAALAGKVLPSHWNDDHDIELSATARVVGRKSSGAGAAEELSIEDVLNLLSTTQNDIPIKGASTWGVVQKAELRVPAGAVFDFAGTTAPSGYLMCYGQAVSRTTYADLYAAIGNAHGSGDGSTTFNLPDCRGRARFGKDDMGGSAANRLTVTYGITGSSLGNVGGSQSSTLTTTELPSHTHSGTTGGASADHTHSGTTSTDGSHTHDLYKKGGAGASNAFELTALSIGGATQAAQSGLSASSGSHSHTMTTGGMSADHSHSFTTGATGSGGAFSNVPPGIVFNTIIKY